MDRDSMSLLVGIDLSEQSERVLRLAVEIAARMQAGLHIVHVREQPVMALPGEMVTASLVEGMIERYDEEALRARNDCIAVCERIIRDRVPFELHMLTGAPAETLLTAVKTWQPAVVVVGSHGRSALKRLLLGSVSTALCQRSSAPVLVIPPETSPEPQPAGSPLKQSLY